MKKALITGILGQDGSYLAELLLSKGYQVHGLVRRVAVRSPVPSYLSPCVFHEGDVTDLGSLIRTVQASQPDEVYNLAAMSFVPHSFAAPHTACDVTGMGCVNMLEAIKLIRPQARFYQASSSEQFGLVREEPQTETTPFYPRSPYGVAKCFAHWMTVNYREAYNLFACCGILMNHESPRRGPEFVTRKITMAVARIVCGQQSELRLGNLDAERDWGHARDYVEAMWRMLQADKPDEFVIATGVKHTVHEFCDLAFRRVGLNYREYVRVDPAFHRPTEVHTLCGHFRKAREKLDWMPRVTFTQLVEEMVDADCELLRSKTCKSAC